MAPRGRQRISQIRDTPPLSGLRFEPRLGWTGRRAPPLWCLRRVPWYESGRLLQRGKIGTANVG